MRRALVLCVALVACTEKTSPSRAGPAPVAYETVRINTVPDGANVAEDGYEICSSTPCVHAYAGAEADPAKEHRLLVSKGGYEVATARVRVGDGPVLVRLTRVREYVPPSAEPDASRFRFIPNAPENVAY